MSAEDAGPAPTPGRNWPALAGLAAGLGAVGLYGLAIYGLGAYIPSVRNDALPNWLLLAVGIGLSALGIRRATGHRPVYAGRGIARLALGFNLVFAAALAWVLYSVTALPASQGPGIGTPAPAFALQDQRDQTVRLRDFRGRPLLLVFYRGHW